MAGWPAGNAASGAAMVTPAGIACATSFFPVVWAIILSMDGAMESMKGLG